MIKSLPDDTLLKAWEHVEFTGKDYKASLKLKHNNISIVVSARKVADELERRGYKVLELE